MKKKSTNPLKCISSISQVLKQYLSRNQLKLLVLFFMICSSRAILAQLPVINSVTPLSGPAGSTVKINASKVDPTPSKNIVYFGAAKATVTSVSGNTLDVIVPNGATYAPVSLTQNRTTAFSTQKFDLTFPATGPLTTGLLATPVIFSADVNANVRCTYLQPADIDGDGKVDIVSFGFDGDNGVGTSDLTLFKNASTVDSISLQYMPVAHFGYDAWLHVADVDADGKLDIIVASHNYTGNDFFSVFRNLSTPGKILFDAVKTFQLPYLGKIKLGDMDLDGKPDVIFNSQDSVYFLKNSSQNSVVNFAKSLNLNVKGGRVVDIADYNNDNLPDLAIYNVRETTLFIYRNHSKKAVNSFGFDSYLTYSSYENALASGDFNGDSLLDVGALDIKYTGNLHVIKNSATKLSDINMELVTNYYTGVGPTAINISDINGDGKPDIFACNEHYTIAAFENASTINNITFNPKVDFAVPKFMQDMAIVDINGDGKPDLVASQNPGSTVYVFKNQLTMSGAAPVITSFFPDGGGTNDTILIKGKNFTGVRSVKFGNVDATYITPLSDSAITAVIGSGATGDISVTTGSGTHSLPGFTYLTQPRITIFTDSTSVCQGSVVTVQAIPERRYPAYHYQWYKNGAKIGDLTKPYVTTKLLDGDSVWATMVNPMYTGSVKSNILHFTVSPSIKPTIVISADKRSPICKGTSVMFTAKITNGGALPVYQWMKNQKPVGTNAPTYTDANLQNGDSVYCVLTVVERCAVIPVTSRPSVFAVNDCSTSGALANNAARMINNQTQFADNANVVSNQSATFNVYPNPANSKVAVTFSGEPGGSYVVQFSDANGRILQSQKITLQNGVSNTQWNVAGYAPGVYHVTLLNKNKFVNSKQLLIGHK
ncbi:FG-GAP-like repeat-containing protein [Danxiaibacter flavus]|uniref:FG-GAP-like repeat-containing protein n=1 Tax=Danxiaibacter flavus TaxID=3049108 RepID=A0ABV3ZMR9_9BACT|nr:FG-GAP-like repeat-containing protein [Chitinophagaceae bacterium DXS]